MTLGGTIFAATSASAVGTETTSGFATGNVAAHREPLEEFPDPFKLKFAAGGTPTKADGTFTFPGAWRLHGQCKVTCYHQEGNRAVFTGPVTKRPSVTH